MQRDRNRNTTVNNKNSKHITVTGFMGDKKETPVKKVRAGQGKPKVAQKIPLNKLPEDTTPEQ